MKFSYVLPDPASYRDWAEFDGDLACIKQAGYDAVELQIADPAEFDEPRVRRSLDAAGHSLCAFQSGSTYCTRGNCLSTGDEAVRTRTLRLTERFVDLAARWNSVMVLGLLQGRQTDEPDREAGEARIEEAMGHLGRYATTQGATIAFEPVSHEQVGFNNTIDSVQCLVRRLDLPGLRMMIDTFHMNIAEKDMLAPLPAIRDILAHVHLSETNHDILGTGHWDTAAFLRELRGIGYAGYCSVGVYNARLPRRECIARCMKAVLAAQG
jgi:5-keto-L-gluconate epimerase